MNLIFVNLVLPCIRLFFFLNDIDIDKEYNCGGEQSNNSLEKYQLL